MRNRLLAVIAAALVSSGCGGGTPQAATGVPTTAASSSTPAETSAQASQSPAPLATFAATAAPVTEAPAGSVAIDMTIIHDRPLFQPNQIQAKAGTITFYLHNVRVLTDQHDFRLGPALLQRQAGSPLVQAGQSIAFTVKDVPPGTYTFWCDVTGGGQPHYQLGMVGTLTVVP